jgi:hypothetical protein
MLNPICERYPTCKIYLFYLKEVYFKSSLIFLFISISSVSSLKEPLHTPLGPHGILIYNNLRLSLGNSSISKIP